MKYTELGSSGIRVSSVCIGGMSFGLDPEGKQSWTLDEKQTENVIAHALDKGINFIDTANQYGGGTSELFIGRALKHLNVPRDKVILASKVFYNDGKLSRRAIFREIEGSLQRLQTDCLDLYQIHRFDYDTPIEETMEALNDLVVQGKVRAIGASSMYAYQLMNMMHCAETKGYAKFVTMQDHWNLIYREDERELIPVCKQNSISLIPYSPLAAGRLARPFEDHSSRRAKTDAVAKRRYDASQGLDEGVIRRLEETAAKYNVSMSRIALAWLYRKGAASVLIGATDPKHFDDAVQADELLLSDEDIADLEALYQPHPLKGPLPRPAGREF